MKEKKTAITLIVLTVIIAIGVFIADIYGVLPEKVYTDADFGIETIKSGADFDKDGTDDYADIVVGAKLDADNRPRYVSKYYADAYPPENEGVCTDLVWRAFASAGYSLKDMVDTDIRQTPDAYPDVEKRDANIDFRRVPNLKIFFDRHATSLTCDLNEIGEWQAGDIVIVNGTKHIGIVSDKRNRNGVPYLLHNGGQPDREQDILESSSITAHYRFDAMKIDPRVIRRF
jgi:uncharacterized protein YijF (DUF1287 family)